VHFIFAAPLWFQLPAIKSCHTSASQVEEVSVIGFPLSRRHGT